MIYHAIQGNFAPFRLGFLPPLGGPVVSSSFLPGITTDFWLVVISTKINFQRSGATQPIRKSHPKSNEEVRKETEKVVGIKDQLLPEIVKFSN
ncbi:MAG: hypothetical protein ABSB79_01610 [Syntrophales bacterium]